MRPPHPVGRAGAKAGAVRGGERAGDLTRRTPHHRQPTFPAPLPRLTPPPNALFRRRSDDAGLTGEIPVNAVPTHTASVHLGDAADRPTLPSSTRAREPVSTWLAPALRTRLRACVESDRPTSASSETSAAQRREMS